MATRPPFTVGQGIQTTTDHVWIPFFNILADSLYICRTKWRFILSYRYFFYAYSYRSRSKQAIFKKKLLRFPITLQYIHKRKILQTVTLIHKSRFSVKAAKDTDTGWLRRRTFELTTICFTHKPDIDIEWSIRPATPSFYRFAFSKPTAYINANPKRPPFSVCVNAYYDSFSFMHVQIDPWMSREGSFLFALFVQRY